MYSRLDWITTVPPESFILVKDVHEAKAVLPSRLMLYDVQDVNQPEMNLRGVFNTNDAGEFWFRTIKPAAYPIPTDGPVGELLRASGRHAMRPAHIHFWIKVDGFKDIITHLFVAGDKYLDSDAVFGVKESLILNFEKNTNPADASKWKVTSPFYHVHFDFKLENK